MRQRGDRPLDLLVVEGLSSNAGEGFFRRWARWRMLGQRCTAWLTPCVCRRYGYRVSPTFQKGDTGRPGRPWGFCSQVYNPSWRAFLPGPARCARGDEGIRVYDVQALSY